MSPNTAILVDGHALTVTDLLRHARVTGGQDFVDRVIDNHLIWREVERRGIAVNEIDLAETLARTYPDQDPSEHGEARRAEIRKTIAFGKLKGEVADELLGDEGRALMARLDRPARRVILDALFLFWLREARQHAEIEVGLDELLARGEGDQP